MMVLEPNSSNIIHRPSYYTFNKFSGMKERNNTRWLDNKAILLIIPKVTEHIVNRGISLLDISGKISAFLLLQYKTAGLALIKLDSDWNCDCAEPHNHVKEGCWNIISNISHSLSLILLSFWLLSIQTDALEADITAF